MANNQKIWTAVAIIAVLVFVGWRIHQIRQPQSDAIKIGAVLPFTGWGAYWTEGEMKGIELAKHDVATQGGSVNIVTEDGGTDPTKSVTAAQKLISVDGVQGMFVEFTGPSAAVAPVAGQNKIPMIYDALAMSPLQQNPYAFKFYFDMEQQCYAGTKYLVNHGHKKIGGLILNLDFNADCQNGMVRAIQGSSSTFVAYNPTVDTVDFRTFIEKMRQDGVDSVLMVLYEDNAAAFFKQRGDLGFLVPVVTGIGRPDGFTDKVIGSASASSLEGTITYDQNIKDSFVQKLKAAYPDIVSKDILEAAYGYDETMYLYTALKSCGSNEDCVKNNLLDSSYESAVDSDGFGANRVLKITPVYYIYTNGGFKNFDIDS